MSVDVVRAEIEAMGKAHSNIAGQMRSELDEPLAAFAGGMKERRKIVQSGIEKLLKVKMQQTAASNKVRVEQGTVDDVSSCMCRPATVTNRIVSRSKVT
jgi:hypothetical protein